MRPTDEVWISLELAEQFFAKGHRIEHGIQIMEGPDPKAEIVDVWFRARDRMIVIKYDRDVPELSLRAFTLEPNRVHQ